MKAILLTILLLVSLASKAGEPIRIELYTYHLHPPFVTHEQAGLTYDLARRLNQLLKGDYVVVVRPLPRSRINYLLKGWIERQCPASGCNDNWLLPWVNPKWGFGGEALKRYAWYPLFEDSNAIVSHAKRPHLYSGPGSLKGLTLAGIRGHRYVGIDALVSNGEINRIDGNRERENLLKVLQGRVDVTLLPSSTVNYFLSRDELLRVDADNFFIAPTKHQVYARQLMVPRSNTKLVAAIARATADGTLFQQSDM